LEHHYLQVTLTDPSRPREPMERLRRRFPHVLVLAFAPETGPDGPVASYAQRMRGRSDLEVATDFVTHVRSPAEPAEVALLAEAGHGIDALLGLSLAQFCQVVLLPQGQFADFLRADAERRRTLLESLFDTGRFTTVERWLVARRQETSRSLDEVDQRLAQVLARLAEAAGADLPADLAPADAAGWVAA